MAISSRDKLVVVKAFAPSNPLPLDAREIYESLAEAHEYAKSSAIAYAGQTIKVVENDTVTVFTLVPSATEGTNFDLQFVGGGVGGVQNVGTSSTEGNISVTVADGDNFKNVNVPVVGALINPVVDEDAHTLTLTKVGATAADNTTVVVPLGGASPADIISKVELGADGTSVIVTKFNVETETESTETINLNKVVTGVTHTAATETSSAKTEFSYKDSTGAAQTLAVFDGGVQKVAAGSTVNKLAITVAGADGTLTTSEILVGVGSVMNPAYDTEDRVITLPVLQADGTTTDLVIDLGKDMVVKSGIYNNETREIELTLTDGSVVKIPATDLVDVYTGNSTNTATVAVSADNVITANVKISTVEGNLIKSDENGLYVVESDFVETKELIENAETNAKAYTDEKVAAEAEARATAVTQAETNAKSYADEKVEAETTAREQAVTQAETNAKSYADEKVEAETTAREQAVTQAETNAKSYADEKVAAEATARGQAVTQAETNAKSYADEKVAAEATARGQAVTQAITDAEAYADEKVAAEATAREQAITQAEANAKSYADTKIDEKIAENNNSAVANVLADAKAYTDEKVGAEVTAREAGDTQTLTDAKAYTDEKVAAVKTAWVDFGTTV